MLHPRFDSVSLSSAPSPTQPPSSPHPPHGFTGYRCLVSARLQPLARFFPRPLYLFWLHAICIRVTFTSCSRYTRYLTPTSTRTALSHFARHERLSQRLRPASLSLLPTLQFHPLLPRSFRIRRMCEHAVCEKPPRICRPFFDGGKHAYTDDVERGAASTIILVRAIV